MIEHAFVSDDTAATAHTGADLNLTPLARRAGIPHPTWASPGLAKRYGLSCSQPLPMERKDLGDLTWAVCLALNGLLPTQPWPDSAGTARLIEFPTFLAGQADATTVRIVASLGPASDGQRSLRLSLPEEFPVAARPVVLLVEDDEAVARCMCLFLARQGFDVIVRNQGAGVVDVARQEQPDVIVLDVDLPDASGIELGQQLKADPQTAAIPLVFCSGNWAAREPALRLGAADFLEKPTEVIQLPARLRAVLACRPAAQKAANTNS